MAKPSLYDQFIWFGDSLTQQAWAQEVGFAAGAAVQNSYVRKLDVINRGFSGYNTSQALQVLPMIMPTPAQAHVRIMTIFFGANDACLPNTTNQHVPLATYKSNLKAIATHPSIQSHAQSHSSSPSPSPSPRLIIITPPPIEETILKAHLLAQGIDFVTRTAETTKAYADAAREVGEELAGVEVLDLWTVFMERAGWREGQVGPLPGSTNGEENKVLKELLCDGLHFTPAAYKLLYNSLMDLITRKWPDLNPDTMPSVLPAYAELPF